MRFAPPGIGDATVTWPFAPTEPGRYRVWARWTAATDRATDAPYTIHHDNGVTENRVNQQIDGERWVSLGTFDFGAGGVNKVVLSDHGNGIVSADAIKFEQVSYGPVRTVAADAARFATNNAGAASPRLLPSGGFAGENAPPARFPVPRKLCTRTILACPGLDPGTARKR